jgi:dynein heavy chain
MQQILEDNLEVYNTQEQNKMDLVFFEDAIKHIVKIARILIQP